MTSLLDRATGFERDLIDLRRDLHRHPELSFCESRTADIAARAVESLGWRVRRGVGRTRIVAELGSGRPLVALRADMDALPIQESSDVDYRSTVDGVMHACGHDAHVSMLIGAARLLADALSAGKLTGTVRLLFQPSEECSDEEGKSGATRMIENGAMEGVEAVFGLHIGAHLESGRAFISPGPIMAGSDLFTATVHGRSSHAGRPHEGTDAIVLAAHSILACQMGAARRISPHDEGTLSIGTIRGGFAENVLAESVSLRGTIRYYSDPVREVLRDALRRGLSVAETLGGGFDLSVKEGYPPVVNDTDATAIATAAVGDVIGAARVVPFERMMGAEDFAILAREAPACFFWLGAGLEPPREHHHPAFDIDERALPIGAASLAACAIRALHELMR
ncbi:MAG TPA: amidohydrolase [Longimicrobiales bacterium]|nr:amidohydrolase [Longimicrobiales bacterium]